MGINRGYKKGGVSLKAPRRSCVADAWFRCYEIVPISIVKGVTDQNPHPDLQCSANALISVWTVDRRAGLKLVKASGEMGGLQEGDEEGLRKIPYLTNRLPRQTTNVKHGNKIKATTIYYLRRTVCARGKSSANL